MSGRPRMIAVGIALGLVSAWAGLSLFGGLGPAPALALAALLGAVSLRVNASVRAWAFGGAGIGLVVLGVVPYVSCPGGALSSACVYPNLWPPFVLGAFLVIVGTIVGRRFDRGGAD